jgi:hypothetical protein
MGKIKGLQRAEIDRESGCVAKGLFVVLEYAAPLELIDKLTAALGGLRGCVHGQNMTGNISAGTASGNINHARKRGYKNAFDNRAFAY